MSDLTERFPNSPELYAPAPDRAPAPKVEGEAEKFLEKHPEFENLQKQEVTSANRVQVLEAVKKTRLENLKACLSSRTHDLSEEEQKFVADVLALRIGSAGSMREALDNVHIDAAEDYNRALVDVKDIRRARAHHEALKDRYPSMPAFAVSPESYVFRGRKE